MSGYTIRDPRQVRCLASPVRHEILDALEALGPCTIAALASRMGRRADALYFHVRALERVGLLVRTGTVGQGREEAAAYDLPGRPLRLDYGVPGADRRRRLGPALDCLLRLARRDVRRALGSAASRAEGPVRDLWVGRAHGWVSEAELERVNALLDEAFRILQSSPAREGAVPVALAFALTPSVSAPAKKSGRPTPRRAAGPAPSMPEQGELS